MIKNKKDDIVNVPWMWKGRQVQGSDVPEWAIGMVYLVEDHVEGKIYVGKKQLTSNNRKRIGVREKTATKTRKTYKMVTKDSGWMKYNTSCIPLQNRLKSGNTGEFTKTVLAWAYSKKNLSWLELKFQVEMKVMEVPSWNECIAGKYWTKDIIKPETKTN